MATRRGRGKARKTKELIGAASGILSEIQLAAVRYGFVRIQRLIIRQSARGVAAVAGELSSGCLRARSPVGEPEADRLANLVTDEAATAGEQIRRTAGRVGY